MNLLPPDADHALAERIRAPFDEREEAIYQALVGYGVSTSTAHRFMDEMRRETVILDHALCPSCQSPVVILRDRTREDVFSYKCAGCGRNFQRRIARA